MKSKHSLTLLVKILGLIISTAQITYSQGMTQDESGRWVNSAGGNLHGDSRTNWKADPNLNWEADPNLNWKADPNLNWEADPNLNWKADPNLSINGQ
jgi:hypothetical protein